MKISCTHCHTIYEIDENLIPVEGREVECSNCQNVWTVKKSTPLLLTDIVKSEPKPEAAAEPKPEPPAEAQPKAPEAISEPRPVKFNTKPEEPKPQPEKKLSKFNSVQSQVQLQDDLDERLAALEALLGNNDDDASATMSQTEKDDLLMGAPAAFYDPNQDLTASAESEPAEEETEEKKPEAKFDEVVFGDVINPVVIPFRTSPKADESAETKAPEAPSNEDQKDPAPAERQMDDSERYVSDAVDRLSAQVNRKKEPVVEEEAVEELRAEAASLTKPETPKEPQAREDADNFAFTEDTHKAKLVPEDNKEKVVYDAKDPKVDDFVATRDPKNASIDTKEPTLEAPTHEESVKSLAAKETYGNNGAEPGFIERQPTEKQTEYPITGEESVDQLGSRPNPFFSSHADQTLNEAAEAANKPAIIKDASDLKDKDQAAQDKKEAARKKRFESHQSNFWTGFFFTLTLLTTVVSIRYLAMPISEVFPPAQDFLSDYSQLFDNGISRIENLFEPS